MTFCNITNGHVFISGLTLLIYFTYKKRHDMERYYINKNKSKYMCLRYAKYILLFCFFYNVKYMIFNKIKDQINKLLKKRI
jgi:hypothetical protein